MTTVFQLQMRKESGCSPPKYERTNNEIARLWDFFRKARNGNLTDKEFKDVLTIKNVAITKLTEVLFYIDPNKNLPINNPIQSYLKNVFEINPNIKTYSDYTSLLNSQLLLFRKNMGQKHRFE